MQRCLLLIGVSLLLASVGVVSAGGKKVVCYLGSWAVYRSGECKFEPTLIDPHICTHVVYSFVGLRADASIRLLDDWCDIGLGGFANTIALKQQNPSLKVLVAIGGWNEGSTVYSNVMNNPTLRARFVDNALSFVLQYGFDGFDLDWEYPGQRGGIPSDRAAFTELVKELRKKFEPHGRTISAAVAACESSASISYDIPEISKNLDFINVMAYDMHGSWDSTTGHHSGLFPRSGDPLNVHTCINYWRQYAADEKLILGIPTYGRTFTLANPPQCIIGARTTGSGPAGPCTRESGMLGYNEICVDEDLEEHWDDVLKVPYACKGNLWVGYENPRSAAIKANYIIDEGLGGAMFWSLETDDFRANCGDATFPIIRAVKNTFEGNPPTEGSSSETEPDPTDPVTEDSTEPNESSPDEPNPDPNEPTPDPDESTPGPDDCTDNQTGPKEPCTKDDQYVEDKCDNKFWYRCVPDGRGGFIIYKFECPSPLVFNPKTQNCDWA